jgi:DNA polymerase-3 subunit epsilon
MGEARSIGAQKIALTEKPLFPCGRGESLCTVVHPTPPHRMTLSDTSFAFVDIETTGGNAVRDRIIEIAVILMENGAITRKWSSLVDPDRPVPSYITDITGITDGDVAHAPSFRGVADELEEMLEGKVFVAHNARFDYGFLKNEFRRLEKPWQAKTLCTVRLSRALYPRHRSHSLDKIIERHGFECENRHRALDDAKVMIDFWQKALHEKGEETFTWCVQSLLKQPSLPSNLHGRSLGSVPDGNGVYLFYGRGDKPIYIGKSVELRSRVLSHFSGDHALPKDMEISKRIRRIEHRETPGELGALLLEASLVKRHLPLFNRKLRRTTGQCAFKVVAGADGCEEVTVVRGADIRPEEFETLFGMYRSERGALESLAELAEAYELCPKKLGLETARGDAACFSYHLKRCRGACAGEEQPADYNMRLRMALSGLKHTVWPFKGRIGVRETNRVSGKSQIHVIDNWCYMGSYDNEEDLREGLERGDDLRFDVDHYRIIAAFLRGRRAKTRARDCDIEILRFPYEAVAA